ncbi:MAG: sugar transferase [Porcipelethomonas sp.]
MRVNIAVRERREAQTIFLNNLSVRPKRIYSFFKRTFDIISSATVLVLLSPVMLVIALAVFLQDFHNPIFSQTRLTKDGRKFKMYKFRSMCIDAEEKLEALKSHNEIDGPAFKMADDPRVTKIGKFLRVTSLDELPQLINVLGGSMSVVGPRPPLPDEVDEYTPYQLQRLCVKGGLTCYWQCSGRSNVSFDEWMDMDIQYIKDRSLFVDVKIIFKTIKAVITRDGAQ